MNKLRGKWIVVVCVMMALAGALCGCQNTREASTTTSQTTKQQKIDISNIDEAYEAILNQSTQEFIGYHLLDEGFLAWFTGAYGTEAVEEVARRAAETDPEAWYDITGKSIQVLWLEYCNDSGFQSYSLHNVYQKDCASEDEIVLDFTGDLTLADSVATTTYMQRQENGIEDCMSENLIDEMNAADIMMINNEFAYTDRGTALDGKAYTFRSQPSRVTELDKLGVDIVNLANNHVWDFGEIGVLDTLQTLTDAEIPYVGAGKNIQEAMEPVYYVANGRKVAIVSATQIERSYNYTREATESTAGVLKTLDPEKYVNVIKTVRKNADYVIAVVHWGTEGNAVYGSDQEKLAKAFVEAGADVIVGGHTHCLQGMEYIDDVPVYYSLGNFYFSSTGNMPADYDTGIAQVVIQSSGEINVRFLPCEFSGGVTSLLEDGGKKQEIIDKIQELSDSITIDSDGNVTKK